MSDQSIEKGSPNYKKMDEIIQFIYDKKEAEPFRVPVDYEAVGLTDYPLIVKKLMDLGTVQKNLRSERYNSLRECLDDLQLIWDNCKLYNVEFSKIYKLAQKLEEYARKIIEERFGKIEYGRNNSSYKMLAEQMRPEDAVDE